MKQEAITLFNIKYEHIFLKRALNLPWISFLLSSNFFFIISFSFFYNIKCQTWKYWVALKKTIEMSCEPYLFMLFCFQRHMVFQEFVLKHYVYKHLLWFAAKVNCFFLGMNAIAFSKFAHLELTCCLVLPGMPSSGGTAWNAAYTSGFYARSSCLPLLPSSSYLSISCVCFSRTFSQLFSPCVFLAFPFSCSFLCLLISFYSLTLSLRRKW